MLFGREVGRQCEKLLHGSYLTQWTGISESVSMPKHNALQWAHMRSKHIYMTIATMERSIDNKMISIRVPQCPTYYTIVRGGNFPSSRAIVLRYLHIRYLRAPVFAPVKSNMANQRDLRKGEAPRESRIPVRQHSTVVKPVGVILSEPPMLSRANTQQAELFFRMRARVRTARFVISGSRERKCIPAHELDMCRPTSSQGLQRPPSLVPADEPSTSPVLRRQDEPRRPDSAPPPRGRTMKRSQRLEDCLARKVIVDRWLKDCLRFIHLGQDMYDADDEMESSSDEYIDGERCPSLTTSVTASEGSTRPSTPEAPQDRRHDIRMLGD